MHVIARVTLSAFFHNLLHFDIELTVMVSLWELCWTKIGGIQATNLAAKSIYLEIHEWYPALGNDPSIHCMSSLLLLVYWYSVYTHYSGWGHNSNGYACMHCMHTWPEWRKAVSNVHLVILWHVVWYSHNPSTQVTGNSSLIGKSANCIILICHVRQLLLII